MRSWCGSSRGSKWEQQLTVINAVNHYFVVCAAVLLLLLLLSGHQAWCEQSRLGFCCG
jgi:hypothetical protein